jgi:hypothetical protein
MSTATRTDRHRPSAPEFDPEDYDCMGVFDLTQEWGDNGDRMRSVNALRAEGYRFASHQTGGVCGHCGARLRYAALMAHLPSKDMIYVGETCLAGRFESTKAEFDRLRKTAALDRAKQARKAAFLELCEQHAVLVWATYAHNIGATALGEETWDQVHGKGWAISALDDIARKARQYGELSQRQAELITKLVAELEHAEEDTATREAEAAARPPAAPVPTGKLVVEGEIVSTRWQDNPYGPGGCMKMLVVTDAGWKVWGTMPAALNASQGDRVRFTATIQPSDDDLCFGFFKRPTKAETLEPVGV